MKKQAQQHPQDDATLLLAPVSACICAMSSDYIRKASQITAILQGKWKLQILCAMRNDSVRLSQLMRLLPAASKKSLRASLRDLEAENIVVRCDLSDNVLHVEYKLVDRLREVIGSLLDQLARWGEIIEAEKTNFPGPMLSKLNGQR